MLCDMHRHIVLGVAPLVGAWIEIRNMYDIHDIHDVAPLVGAWIEIAYANRIGQSLVSLPLWERGLKSIKRYII